MRCVEHEGVWKVFQCHAEIGADTAVVPDVFDVDAVLVLEAHLRDTY